MSLPEPENYDIIILGSGIACSSFLLQFLEKLRDCEIPEEPFRIAVIEKHEEFWKGVPYGNRSSPNSLTITTLGEFIPPSEKKAFLKWLVETKQEWINHLNVHGGETGREWVKNNLASIDAGKWDEMYVPRNLFGNFVHKRISAAIEKATLNRTAIISTITAEATDISRSNGLYEVIAENGQGSKRLLSAPKVVLSIGSPPTKSLLAQGPEKQQFAYLNDTYTPSLEQNLAWMRSVLAGVKDPKKRNILMLGSNASSLELLYLADTDPALQKLLNKIVVISYSGRLPYRITPNSNTDYKFEHVADLKSKKFTPSELMAIIEKDVRIADDKGVHIGNVYYLLNDLLVSLLAEMDQKEQKHFYDNYGQRFSKLIRRAGAEYRDAASDLENKGKLELIRGSFQTLAPTGDSRVAVSYAVQDRKEPVVHPMEFALVINCGGAEELNPSTSSSLINALISKELCVINKTGRGVEVSENFEAAEGLYIMGPLLGGIFNNRAKLWHVENAKSIFHLGNMLAGVFVDAVPSVRAAQFLMNR